jgi:predicted esterase
MELYHTLRVCLEPDSYEWYPAPNGVNDQTSALRGMKYAVKDLNGAIKKIQHMWNLPRKKIALAGYSAGGVMALQMCSRSYHPFAGIASVSGAILDPASLKPAKHDTPILIRHNIDDDCFKWEERYLPMKEALQEKNYNVSLVEGQEGGHGLSRYDAELAGNFLAPLLGY